MRWYSLLAIYLLFWTFAFFLVLPWGIRTSDEMGERMIPGQAPSAPHAPQLGRKLLVTTALSAAGFLLFVANWEYGWITREAFFALFFDPAQPR